MLRRIVATIDDDRAGERQMRAYWGLTRSLIQNMVVGVTEGYEKKLEINGVGYNATLEGPKVIFNLGFAHQVFVDIPKGLTVECPNQTTVIVRGCDNIDEKSVIAPTPRKMSAGKISCLTPKYR